MKRSLILLAALTVTSGTVMAQSSVILYGIIDNGIEYVSNVRVAPGVGKSLYQLDSVSGLQGSRWGLRGAEDLGGGLKAIFVLENGFDANNGKLGQGGAEFGRQAYVGVSSGYGTATLGRQLLELTTACRSAPTSTCWASIKRQRMSIRRAKLRLRVLTV